MVRILLSAMLLLALLGRAAGESSFEGETSLRSRLLVEILGRYGSGGHSVFCIIDLEVSQKFKYRQIALPASFYARFVDGQFDNIMFNPPGCPTPEKPRDACEPSCGLITVFDFSAWGYPPPWAPWPRCESERFTFTQSRYRPDGAILMVINLHHEWELHHYLEIIAAAPCLFLVHEDTGIIE
jgi:hypothetical protein